MLPGLRKSTALWAGALASLGAFAALYVTLGRSDNAIPPPPGARASPEVAPASTLPAGAGHNPVSQGQMAAFVFRSAPEALPRVTFRDAAGRERTLADWHGKVVLLNLWATWCLPCRTEMPALDRLQGELGSDAFEVLAVCVDRAGLPGARKFLAENGVARLALYADATQRLASSLRATGLPATLLIDGEGREIGRLLGPAEWDGPDAKRLIHAALK
jgi:thiol-disulfide isomerase/thioredoxin